MRYECYLLWGHRKKTAVEQANVLAAINHTSVVSWMHTNLYVLDLCGRSNLTKTIQVLVVGARTWLMRTTYIRASERVRRKGETELEDTVKWQIDGGRLRGGKGLKKRVTTWFTIRQPPGPLMPYIQTFYLTFKILRVVENKKHNQKAQIPQVTLKRLVKKQQAFTKTC